MKTILRVFTWIIVIGVIIGVAVAFYIFRKSPESVANKKADIIITSSQLVADYVNDEQAANQKYLDKVLEVSGIVAEVSSDSSGVNITLRDSEAIQGVVCRIIEKNNMNTIAIGDSVTVKGICTGYLMDVNLNKGVIVSKH